MMLAALCHGIPHSVYRTYFKDDMVVEYFDEKEDKIYLNKPSLFFKNIIKVCISFKVSHVIDFFLTHFL